MSQLGDKVKKLRVARGLSQRKLAKLSDLSNDYISKIELGRATNVGLETLDKIAKALEISSVELQASLKSVAAKVKSSSLKAAEKNPLYGMPTDDKTRQMMKLWINLYPSQKAAVLDFLRKMASSR